ncbi:MAG: bugT [Ramlibacter sp.]|nr:bugT [Ramlibacter sp.]
MKTFASLVRRALLAFAACAAAASVLAAEPGYPSKPIRLLVGYAPGGGGDSVARIVAEHMGRTLHQTIVIENRPGAGTTLAPAAAAAAAPDGYTLALVSEARFGADKLLWRPNVKYDEASFTPVARWATTFFVLAVNKDYGVKRVADLLAKAKQSNNEVFMAATQGIFTSLIINSFKTASGVTLSLVPYKGGAPAVQAVLAGEVPVTFAVPTSVLPLARDGKLVALAVTGDKRSALAPELPTLQEEGLAGFNVGYWFGIAGPAGMADDVVQKLFDASNLALADPGVRSRLALLGYEPAPARSPAEFRGQALQDGAALRKTVEALGLKGD